MTELIGPMSSICKSAVSLHVHFLLIQLRARNYTDVTHYFFFSFSLCLSISYKGGDDLNGRIIKFLFLLINLLTILIFVHSIVSFCFVTHSLKGLFTSFHLLKLKPWFLYMFVKKYNKNNYILQWCVSYYLSHAFINSQ